MSVANHLYVLAEPQALSDGVPRFVDVRGFSRAVIYTDGGVLSATPRLDRSGTAIPGAAAVVPTSGTIFDLQAYHYEFESTGADALLFLLT